MYLFCVCEYIRSTICVQYAQRAEDGIGLPETGVMNGCVPPRGAGNWRWFPSALDCEDTLYDHLQRFLLCPSVWHVMLGQLHEVPSALYSVQSRILAAFEQCSLWFYPACFTFTPECIRLSAPQVHCTQMYSCIDFIIHFPHVSFL